MRLQMTMKLPGQYHKNEITKRYYTDDYAAYYGSFVRLDPSQRPFINQKEVNVQTYVLYHLNQYKMDMALAEREQRIIIPPSYKTPDMIFYYPEQPRIQDNIAFIIECKRSNIKIDGDRWWEKYVYICMKACARARYGMLTNGNESRFCIRYGNSIEEVDEDVFWEEVQLTLSSDYWMKIDEKVMETNNGSCLSNSN